MHTVQYIETMSSLITQLSARLVLEELANTKSRNPESVFMYHQDHARAARSH